jgi:DNA-directed RNA polymerase subunit RPC12/RpoP
MNRDRIDLVATAFGAFTGLVTCLFFAMLGYTMLAVCTGGMLFLAAVALTVNEQIKSAINGPKSLSGTRCRKCRKRRAMQEVSRTFLRENTDKVHFDHIRVVYRCAACRQETEQVEFVGRRRSDTTERSETAT